MNFSPFGGHFSTSIPTIHQFAAKFGHENAATGALCPQDANSNRYTANGVPSFTQHHPATPSQQHVVNNKYQAAGNYLNQGVYVPQNVRVQEKRYEHQQELAQELCVAMLQQNNQNQPQQQPPPQQQQVEKVQQSNEKIIKQENHQQEDRNRSQHQHPQNNQVQQPPQQQQQSQQINPSAPMSSAWQSLAAPGSTVADYLSHLPASTLPLSLHHFLKYSAETIKKENAPQLTIPGNEANMHLLHNNGNAISTLNTLTTINTAQLQTGLTTVKKKKKKKVEKEKKPRPKPGEIRLTTALDGSTLYCCPECHMAYPEKELLEQHLVGHTLERRFVCDICGAGLKRKDHLTRHKQSHNPERPYVCTVCLKAFKRKEQLTLHFVIHSGEKRHICTECGKGFYRKDHLRKHTRSHIARRVKAELSQQGPSNPVGLQLQVAGPIPTSTTNSSGILS